MRKHCLTEKQMANRRFCKTEEALQNAICNSEECVSAGKLARKAKVSRVTLYRHHGAVYWIVPNYERYVICKFKRVLKKVLRRENVGIRTIYSQMLVFILGNKKMIGLIMEKGSKDFPERIVECFERKIVERCRLPKNSKKMIKVYKKEVAGIIEDWNKKGFSEDEVSKVLDDIMYLTNTLRSRLRPLER